MDKIITSIDDSIEKQTECLKEFLGLSTEQTFQDLDVYENFGIFWNKAKGDYQMKENID